MLNFGNLSLLGRYSQPGFGMRPVMGGQFPFQAMGGGQPYGGMPVHYPGAFNPQPVWGGQPPMQGPVQMPTQQPMPAQGTMQRYPLASNMMPGRLNLGALGRSGMMRSPQAY